MKAVSFLLLTSLVWGQLHAHDLDSYAQKARDYNVSPVTRYIDQDKYQQILNETVNSERILMESKVYTINTYDQEGCEDFRMNHNIHEDICQINNDAPLVSIMVTNEVSDSQEFEKKLTLAGLSKSKRQFVDSSIDFGVMGLAAFGALYAMPESVSKWDKSRGFSDMASKYSERVKEGPVWDKDDWVINYIGHPLSGAYYYTMVRHKGLSIGQSALFSVVMSTFFWEYGIEAFAEVPSIQDLIFTPLLGSILGEMFYQWAEKIDANNGKFLGSEKLGKTAKILMNPAGSISNVINNKLGLKYVKQSDFSIVSKKLKFQNSGPGSRSDEDNFIGIQFKFVH